MPVTVPILVHTGYLGGVEGETRLCYLCCILPVAFFCVTTSKSTRNSSQCLPIRYLKTAVLEIHFRGISLHAAQMLGITIGKVVHGLKSDVEAVDGYVDGQDVDGAVVVGQSPACSTLRVESPSQSATSPSVLQREKGKDQRKKRRLVHLR